ncbi:hypothetical protein [Reyranella sp.]|uniref:hypothetical protein n=1 Tax=Reyranella sp. TaxID=1929291 RepID=UPI003D0DD049
MRWKAEFLGDRQGDGRRLALGDANLVARDKRLVNTWAADDAIPLDMYEHVYL